MWRRGLLSFSEALFPPLRVALPLSLFSPALLLCRALTREALGEREALCDRAFVELTEGLIFNLLGERLER